jgi:carboxyl-terminal processing protease
VRDAIDALRYERPSETTLQEEPLTRSHLPTVTRKKGDRMPRKGRFLFGVVTGVLTALAFGANGGTPGGKAAYTPATEGHALPEQFRQIYQLVRQRYVTSPDEPKLVEAAINGLLQTLDPHSAYLDAETYQTIKEEASGVFGGVALQVTTVDGLVKIAAIVAKSHAAKAGLRPGDVILRVDGLPVSAQTVNQAVIRMRGPVDSTVRLTIRRNNQSELIEVVVVRDLIRVQTVLSRPIGGDVGYIKITKFNDLTGEDLQRAVRDLSVRIPARQLRGYILDLRNNPGGVVEQAVSVASAFLEHGDIVITRGRNPEDNRRFTATGALDDLGKVKPLIVLINGGSASAAEIVAGALQDHKRATVVGTRSFGKGSIQSTLPVGEGGGALRLTTALYYTPSGRSIQARGITPDIEVMQEAPERQTSAAETNGEATLRNHLKGNGEERAGSEIYVPPNSNDDKALTLALDLFSGRSSHPDFSVK